MRTKLSFVALRRLLHLDSHLFAHAFENYIDGLDNSELRICLAINDQLVLGFSTFSDVHVVLLRQTVVPPAVPGSEQVGLVLPRPGELGAGQRLDVEKSFRVGIFAEIPLGPRARTCHQHREAERNSHQTLTHIFLLRMNSELVFGTRSDFDQPGLVVPTTLR